MTAPPTEYDYEAIVIQFAKKDNASSELEAQKNDLSSKHWNALRDYQEAKAKYDQAEAIYNEVCNERLTKMKIRSDLDQQRVPLEEKLKQMQQLATDLETQQKKQGDEFYNKTEELFKKIKDLPREFNNENMKNQIDELAKSINFLKQGIVNAYNELEAMKNATETANPDIYYIKDITELILKETAEKYEEPPKAKARLSKSNQDIKFLSKKIQDMKVKLSI